MIATTVSTKFVAVDGWSPVVKKMEHNLASLTERANIGIARQERLFRRLTPSLGHATKQLLSYAGAGAVLGGAAFSGKAIMDYETAIQSLSAVTGVSGSQLEIFKKDIKSVADQTHKSATDVAGSFEVIGSMMSQYLTDPKALRQISEAGITSAKASRQELVPTLENLTSIMNQFNLVAGQSADVVNKLTAGEIVGSLKTNQVAESLQQFGANAATANVSLAESVALLEALAKQRPAENLGIDARNLLIIMDSAKALDKKARKSLRKSGVDMDFLMNKTHSLSERLHELSKVQGDAVGMAHVFGERNMTAAKVIFNQLGTYDAYLAKIKVTNQAQSQAATNSNTLAVAVAQLRDTWINYIATGDTAASGLEKLKNGARFLAENMDTIVSVGVNVLKFMALWKGAIIAQKIVTGTLSVATGIQSVVLGYSSLAMKGNTIALGVQSVATTILTADVAALNAMMAANPISLVILATAALVGGTYALIKNEERLRDIYKKKIDLETDKTIAKETQAINDQIYAYWKLGDTITRATEKTLLLRKGENDFKRAEVEKKIVAAKADVKADNKSIMGRFGLAGSSFAGNTASADSLNLYQQKAKELAGKNVAIQEEAQKYVTSGAIDKKNIAGVFNNAPVKTEAVGQAMTNNETSRNPRAELYSGQPENAGFDYRRMAEAFTQALKSAQQSKVDVTISGLPAGVSAKSNTNKINTGSSY